MKRMKEKAEVPTYMLLFGFFIHSLNQPVVSCLQPSTSVLQAKEIAFTWLYLEHEMIQVSEECSRRAQLWTSDGDPRSASQWEESRFPMREMGFK